MSKLGLHIHSWNHAILEYCKNVGGAVHFILDHNEMMVNEIKRAQPKSLLIARLWVDQQKLNDPIKNAQEFTDLLLLHIDGCHYDVASGYNEWDGDLSYCDGREPGKEIFKRYADFEAERSRILHREGLLSVVGGCSVGTPPEHWFSGFKPALEEGDFLHLHEYSAPAMCDAVNWHCLKYRHVYKYLKEHSLPMLPLIISECGVDGGVVGRPREGWRKFGPQGMRAKKRDYMNQWDWYDSELREDDYVVGSCAFDCGGGGGLGWASFNMDPEMLSLYAERIEALGVSYWEPKEEEEMVDSPLAQWRQGVPLGNYSKGPTEKTEIVLHSTGGSFTSAVNWFLDPDSEVSAQYVIGRGHAGEPKIYQMIKEDDIAHHATDWEANTKSIGVECADDNLDYLTEAQRARLVALCKDIVARNPIERIRLHREIVATKCPQAISDAEGDQIIQEVLKGTEAELLVRIAELEKKNKDDKTAMVAARNILNQRIDA